MNKIIFLDRDGVINVDPIGDYIKRWEDFRFEKGSLEALKAIYDAGYEIIIISNQAGVGDEIFPEASLWDIHKKMLKELEAHGIKIRSSHFCLHGKEAGCSCRKPETGLFKEAVQGIQYNPQETYFIGDKFTDVLAGKRFGLKTIFVMTGHGKLDKPKFTEEIKPDLIAENLLDAVKFLK